MNHTDRLCLFCVAEDRASHRPYRPSRVGTGSTPRAASKPPRQRRLLQWYWVKRGPAELLHHPGEPQGTKAERDLRMKKDGKVRRLLNWRRGRERASGDGDAGLNNGIHFSAGFSATAFISLAISALAVADDDKTTIWITSLILSPCTFSWSANWPALGI